MVEKTPIEIDGDRLLADLRELATFGKVGTGVDRTAFSEPDMEARQWLRERMAAAGLKAAIDGVGNVLGRSPVDGRGVLIGSHTDSVPKGGWLDGAMGVIYGLEVARAARESDGWQDGVVDVVAFQDEEGTFLPCLGSKSLCGEIADDEIAGARDATGRSLREAIAAHGLDQLERPTLSPDRYGAYLEAHIEQGPRLEASGRRIGIVTGIVGIRRFIIGAKGQADHAGTTPMSMRRDAGAALIRVAAQLLDRFAQEGGPDTVWNIGKMTFEPGAANVVPSGAEIVVEFRDTVAERLDRLESIVADVVSGATAHDAVQIELTRTAAIPPIDMDPDLARTLADAARAHGQQALTMPSGAGHDAMVVGRHLPTAMLFVPSIGGRSHDIVEDTAEADIVLGCEVLADAVADLLRGSR